MRFLVPHSRDSIRESSFVSAAALVAWLGLFSIASAGVTPPRTVELPIVGEGSRTFVSTGTRSSAKAAADSVFLYGGPGTLEGKFETSIGTPDKGGWIGVDATDIVPYWHWSEFNASTLNDNGPGNLAAWCGRSAADEPGWQTAPGYGNGRDEVLIFEVDVTNPAAGQVVGLDFFFHYETEEGYDYFHVEYDSAGTWKRVFQLDGTDRDSSGEFLAPGTQYAAQPSILPIAFDGGGYSIDDKIRVRLRFTSDGGWSDEDGLFDSDGAAQIDDITVTCSEGVFFEDFEAAPYHWMPDKVPFVGDFFDVYSDFTDLDPCLSNLTPVAGFLDRGQDVNNSASSALIPGYPTSTGGQTSPNWSYGVPGGWVLNYQGGLTGGTKALNNEMWSPAFDWDLPGPEDDGADYMGAILRYDQWTHLPLINGMFTTWAVRSSIDGIDWGPWKNRAFADISNLQRWQSWEREVTDLIEPGATKIQIRLGVQDLAGLFGFPGTDATPSPIYDNVSFQKYRIGGPVLSVREVDLAQGGFPRSGAIDASTLPLRDGLDIPFDMALDRSSGFSIIPGDSVVVDAVAVISGTTVTEVRMVWVLDKNPFFEDLIRAAPSRSVDENVDTSNPLQWSGQVVGQLTYTSGGALIGDRYNFDLPDVNFLYPGDRLRYYFRATDSDARVTTLPVDVSNFWTGEGYDRSFSVNGLPSLESNGQGGQRHPRTLVIDESSTRGDHGIFDAMFEMGFYDGDDYDTYRVQAASSGISNGIGSAGGHGANAQQLEGYDTILYFAGYLTQFLLSDGTEVFGNDKSDDVGVLTAWHNLTGNRLAIYFGDNLASFLGGSAFSPGHTYLTNVMSVKSEAVDVGNQIGGQTAPVVVPTVANLDVSFLAFGGCPTLNRFDHITPLAPAVRAHAFDNPAFPGAIYSPAASVIHDRLVDGDRKVDMTFPFGFRSVRDLSGTSDPASNALARAFFLRELFDYFGVMPPPPRPDVPDLTKIPAELSVHPSPFNPRTVVSLSIPATGESEVEIYDLRGRRVRVLHRGELEAGPSIWVWEGTDDAGASVASGVYVVRAKGQGFDLKKKAVLLK